MGTRSCPSLAGEAMSDLCPCHALPRMCGKSKTQTIRSTEQMKDEHGLYIVDEPAVITSVEPLEGAEGTIVTLKGSGFSRFIRNNCIVVANLGACARPQEGSTS